MTFSTCSHDVQGSTPARPTRWRRWALAACAVLAACGGGTSQFDPFVAGRVLVVGDELSAMESDGRKYAVNGLKTDGTLDCSAEGLWVQTIAGFYGLVFKECNPGNATTFNAIMLAAAGARVADISAQVDTQIRVNGGFRDKDLVLALGGMNDVVDLYKIYKAGTQPLSELQNEARARGERMAGIVNRLIDLQAKVIVSTIPDLGLSPLAIAEEASRPGSAAVLSELTRLFNERLGVKVLLDGRYVGLMQTDLRTQLAARFPASYGLADASTAVCTTKPPACTTKTLLTNETSAGSFFWADGTLLSTGGQSQLAGLAIERASRNPF